MAVAPFLGPLLVPVAKKLAMRGASKLAGLLLDGPAAEAVAGPIVDRVFREFDLPQEKGAVKLEDIDALVARHADRVDAAVGEVARDNSADWAALWQAQVSQVNQTMRGEQAAQSALSRIWRPVFGLGFTAIYVLLGLSFVASILTADDPLNGLVALSGLVIAFVGSGAAVLGVQVWSRGEEKKAGVAR